MPNSIKNKPEEAKQKETHLEDDIDTELMDELEQASNMLADNFRKIYLLNKVWSSIRLINKMKEYGLKFETDYQQELASINEEAEEEESFDTPEDQMLDSAMNDLADNYRKMIVGSRVFGAFRVLIQLKALNK